MEHLEAVYELAKVKESLDRSQRDNQDLCLEIDEFKRREQEKDNVLKDYSSQIATLQADRTVMIAERDELRRRAVEVEVLRPQVQDLTIQRDKLDKILCSNFKRRVAVEADLTRVAKELEKSDINEVKSSTIDALAIQLRSWAKDLAQTPDEKNHILGVMYKGDPEIECFVCHRKMDMTKDKIKCVPCSNNLTPASQGASNVSPKA